MSPVFRLNSPSTQRGTAKKRMSIEYFCNCVYFGIIFLLLIYFRGPARAKNRRNILIGTTSNCFPLSRWNRTAQKYISGENMKNVIFDSSCNQARALTIGLYAGTSDCEILHYCHNMRTSGSMCCEPNSVSFQLTRVSFRLICFT